VKLLDKYTNKDPLVGKIFLIEDDVYFLKTKSSKKIIKSHKAFSCLISPMMNDTVLLIEANDEVYITDILKRENISKDIQIKCDGKIAIKSNDLQLNIKKDIRINVKSVISVIQTAKSFIDNFELSTLISDIKSKTFKTTSQKHFNTSKELYIQAGTSVTNIEGHQENRSKSSKNTIENMQVTQAQSVSISADETVKIDGKSIHMA
jgi:hypothetical protein